ncbi:hypothetical protein ACPOL_3420 [Acidisarcina polymorpha]|uniref:Uncharacterized protein n=1 Tax=Acidisarcina polymorpha TaxID=2211140 RepID=A0A2Z5G1U6_9BACT|nr:hypothetical protein [Acidisarcina polymorpha]AXC12707.1 hypothetical protein ACPOL_3420 [Acidisarcina polymorpha]
MSPNELQELIPVAKTLNEESDGINATITDLNRKLSALNIGIEVWIDPEEAGSFQFGYARIDSGKDQAWELALRHRDSRKAKANFEAVIAEGDELMPGPAESLLRAARNVRIEALEVVPLILRNLKQVAERNIETIKRAKQLASEL